MNEESLAAEEGRQGVSRSSVVEFAQGHWRGYSIAVADSANQETDTVAIRKVNEKLAADERVTLSLVPIGDGLTLARKR